MVEIPVIKNENAGWECPAFFIEWYCDAGPDYFNSCSTVWDLAFACASIAVAACTSI